MAQPYEDLRKAMFFESILLNYKEYRIQTGGDIHLQCISCMRIHRGFGIIATHQNTKYLLFQANSEEKCPHKILIIYPQAKLIEEIEKEFAIGKVANTNYESFFFSTHYDTRYELEQIIYRLFFVINTEKEIIEGLSLFFNNTQLQSGEMGGQYTIKSNYPHKSDLLMDIKSIFPNTEFRCSDYAVATFDEYSRKPLYLPNVSDALTSLTSSQFIEQILARFQKTRDSLLYF